eukprot:14121931-Alexandrium_andersonii.AAC.1
MHPGHADPPHVDRRARKHPAKQVSTNARILTPSSCQGKLWTARGCKPDTGPDAGEPISRPWWERTPCDSAPWRQSQDPADRGLR